MLNIIDREVSSLPFPHIVCEDILPPELYRRLVDDFPSESVFHQQSQRFGETGSRTGPGDDIYRGDEAYLAQLQNSKAWKELDEYINSKDFVERTFQIFGKHFIDNQCTIEMDKVQYTNYIEPRETLTKHATAGEKLSSIARSTLNFRKSDARKNELFTRLDIHCGREAYGKKVHCDRANRLVSLVIYFCDADEIGMHGGQLQLFKHKETKTPPKYERHPDIKNVDLVAEIKPKQNLGVFFMCCNNSYHGVAPITQLSKPRRFLYINISSRSKDIW